MLQRLATASALIVIVVLAGRHAAAAAPSFDCTKAQSWAEKQICGDDKLAALDAWLSPLFNQVVQRSAAKDADALKAQRKAWFKARNDCKAEADGNACLAQRYQDFIGDLEHRFAALVGGGSSAAPSAAPAPAKSALDECRGGDKQSCLEKLLDTEDANLTDAEAAAQKKAGQDSDKVEASNVAWRGFRNAECKRRSAGGGDQTEGYTACLIDLTRDRVSELQM
jgi:uncharacterized protein